MIKLKIIPILFASVLLLLTTSCMSGFYIAIRCDEQKKNHLQPVFNATWLNQDLMREAWRHEDYVLPVWLDRSLSTIALLIDLPFSLCFDVITFPFQGIDYWVRYDAIQNARQSNREIKIENQIPVENRTDE